jgi:hypothetical protein
LEDFRVVERLTLHGQLPDGDRKVRPGSASLERFDVGQWRCSTDFLRSKPQVLLCPAVKVYRFTTHGPI